MSDKARDWTDEQLDDLASRFERVYNQAADEMRAKLEASLKGYATENEQRQKAMDNTPEARAEYEAWKSGRAADQAWMRQMVDTLSDGAHNANRLAADMTNDAIPRIYSENANMEAFALEKRLGYDVGFTLVNEDAVRYLMGLPLQKAGDDQLLREVTWDPDPERSHVQDLRKREVDYPKDMRWNRQKFTSAITQGILQGESIPNIVKRTRSIYGMNKNSAIRAARTATTNAENAGRMSAFERAQRLGIDMEIEWLATPDGRTRDSHRAMDGERIQLGQKFSNGLRWPSDPLGAPSEVWNCFIGETSSIPLGCVERSFRHFYSGDAVTVKTASGVEFTCTPNHPILTTEGWIAAGLLNDGDNLFVADLGNNLRGSGIKPDVKHVGARLDAIHELLDVLANERATSLSVYFHEDVPTSNVDVVGKERALRVNPDTLSLEPVNELTLKLADTLTASDGTLMVGSSASMAPSDGFMGSSSESGTLLWGSIRHALKHGLRAVSGRDSSSLEPDVYDTSTDAEVLGESLDALSAVIKLDHIVNVDIHPISTHVYNLQTESGTYLVNNNDSVTSYVIAHNCRCRANGRVVGFDGKRGAWADERGERWTRLPEGMTYDEWRQAKAVSREKSYENQSKIRDDFWPNNAVEGKQGIAELEAIANRYRDEVNALARDAYGTAPSDTTIRQMQGWADRYAGEMSEHEWAKDFDIKKLEAEVDKLYEKQSKTWEELEELKKRRRALRGRYDDESTEEYIRLLDKSEKLREKYDSYFQKVDDAYKKIDAHKSYNRAKRNFEQYSEELERKIQERNKSLARIEEAKQLLPDARRKRNQAYQNLSDAQPFAPHVRKSIGDEYADTMLHMVGNAEANHPEIAGLYKRFSSQLRVAEKDMQRTAFYRHSDLAIHFNAAEDSEGNSYHAPYQTVFHEFGHLIDDVGGFGTRYTSVESDLERTIKSDWARFRNQTGRNLGVTRNKNDATIAMLNDEVMEVGQLPYTNVSDIIEGCTRTSYPLGIGHGATYHTRDGATAKEFFAEVCDSAIANEEAYQQMRRIFPNAVDMVENMAREMLE